MGDIWSLFSKDDVPKRSVEQDVPKRSVGQEVCDRRKEVMVLFQGQKFLVLGGEGHGKSSLINTFSHVIGLADPNIVYEEVAQVGAGSGSTKTVLLTRYRKEDSMLFHGEKETAPSNFPEFLDTVGMNENNQLQVRIVKLVRALAAGKIKEGADLQDMLKDFNPSFDDMQPDEDMAAWSIIFVGSIVHQPLLDLAKSVGAAADKRTKQGTDKAKDAVSEKEKQLLKDYSEALRIPKSRIMKLSNYTADDIRENGRTKPNAEKELQVLNAFHRILSKSGARDRLNDKAKREGGSGCK